MRIRELPFEGAFAIEPEPVTDSRGIFSRIFCRNEFQRILNGRNIVQINHSMTRKKGSIRGMHFQYPPKSEVKMVKCLRGSVFDVMIDLRNGSSTFLKWHGEILSADNMKMMFIPEGFAHGFQALEKYCELLYFHTEIYSPEHEGGVRYDDSKVGIKWPLEITHVSEKDQNHPLLSEDFSDIVITGSP